MHEFKRKILEELAAKYREHARVSGEGSIRDMFNKKADEVDLILQKEKENEK